MPRFHFHVREGNSFIEDEEGCELPDAEAARAAAILSARDVMAGDPRNGELDLTPLIEVEDQGRRPLFTLRFADAVKIKTGD